MTRAAIVIRDAFERFGSTLAVSSSFQKGGMVVLDLAVKVNPEIRIVTADTGRLPAETFSMIDAVKKRYGVRIEIVQPDLLEVSNMVARHGLDLYLHDRSLRMLCCQIRKVIPFNRAISRLGVEAILTGLRRDQSDDREDIPEVDESSSPIKFNPIAAWTQEDVDRYTEEHALPVHPLYASGYTSIGCEPCTRATEIGEHQRAGRWWWEGEGDKECGMHFTPDGRIRRTVDVLVDEIVNPC